MITFVTMAKASIYAVKQIMVNYSHTFTKKTTWHSVLYWEKAKDILE